MSIIAFSGIAGCGKSTLATILGCSLSLSVFHEPEEVDWPDIITNQVKYDQASALLAFRQLWAKQFTDAYWSKQNGKSALIDTYFFQIYGYYLGKPNLEWLLQPDNPYLNLLIQLNELDQTYFYDADYVVLFEVNLEDWRKFLKSRGRNWDTIPGFAESFAQTQKYVADATIAHCEKKHIKLVLFKHEFGNPQAQAQKLQAILEPLI